MSRGLLLLLVGLPLAAVGCGDESDFSTYQSRAGIATQTLEIGGETITVETAINVRDRAQGLKERPAMPANHGMFFAFTGEEHQRFWMKDTYIPLSIAFIARDGRITNIEDRDAHVESPGAISHEKVMFALEMNKGWFEDHGVSAGLKIELPQWVLDLPVE